MISLAVVQEPATRKGCLEQPLLQSRRRVWETQLDVFAIAFVPVGHVNFRCSPVPLDRRRIAECPAQFVQITDTMADSLTKAFH